MKIVKAISKEIENILTNRQLFYIITIILICLAAPPTQILASSITTSTFKPIVELIYIVMKVAGVIIALIGFGKLVLSFSNEQPDSRFSSAMQIICGVALFFSDGILSSLGMAL